MSRIMTLALAGTTALGLSAGSFTAAEAAPLPAVTSGVVGGPAATVDKVGWRGGYGYRGYRGYGYRRGIGPGGALAAGAALGIIGGAIAASAAPRYGYGGYGYGYPAYGYGYAAPAYSYGYAPAYGYGYPAYYGY